MQLTRRFEKQIELMPKINTLADIGSDHALLCVFAIKANKAKSALACDISDKSLDKARRYIDKYEMQNLISLRVGDGVGVLNENEADLISVCGIGGNIISKILLKDAKILNKTPLLLSPNGNEDILRKALCEINYVCKDEAIVFENSRFYQIMLMEHCENTLNLNENEWEFGEINLANKTDELYALCKKKLKDAKKMHSVANASGNIRAVDAKAKAQKRILRYEEILNEYK